MMVSTNSLTSSVVPSIGIVKLRHPRPIRPQDVGNAVRSSPIIWRPAPSSRPQLDSNGTARVGGGHRGVTEIVRSLESTEQVVIACGVWSPRLAAMAGATISSCLATSTYTGSVPPCRHDTYGGSFPDGLALPGARRRVRLLSYWLL